MTGAARPAAVRTAAADALRPIDATRFAGETAPGDLGPAAQLQWLPIDRLVVDEHYQRPIARQGGNTVRAIIRAFDWRMFAPVVVCPVAGGLYAIVDGQHRATAALACGLDQVPCAVIMADRRIQAAAFGAINGTVTRVSRHQQYKAALAAGDPVARRVDAVARAAGVRILFANKTALFMKPGETLALEAIRRAIAAHGEDLVTRTLKAIVASAGPIGGHLRSPIITAVVTVLADHREWDDDGRLAAAFAAIDLDGAWRAATSEAARRLGLFSSDMLQARLIAHLEHRYGPVATSPGTPAPRRVARATP